MSQEETGLIKNKMDTDSLYCRVWEHMGNFVERYIFCNSERATLMWAGLHDPVTL